MSDDDEDYPPEGGCLGIGATHAVSERAVRKIKNHPIGFVHFKDPEPIKARKPRAQAKRKRRK